MAIPKKKKKKPLDLWNLHWTDKAAPAAVYSTIKATQKVNHIPGMAYLFTDAALFTKSLKKMRKAFYLDYNIFPKTWLWPLESEKVKAQYERRNNVFIVKEQGDSSGLGYVVESWQQLLMHVN